MSSDTISTPTTSSGAVRLEAIDGLRAVAALMVYTYHLWQNCGSPDFAVSSFRLSQLLESFTTGVDLFMVLSGFCLFWPFASNPNRLQAFQAGKFFERRLWRIVPAYYANIVFVTLLPLALVIFWRTIGKEASWQELPTAFDYFTHLFFVHTFFEQTWASIQGVYWSLGVEMQFYLVFPLVIFLYRRLGIMTTLAMIGVCLVYRCVVAYSFLGYTGDWVRPFLWRSTFIGCWIHFASGMLAASYVQHLSLNHGSTKTLPRLALMTGLVGWFLMVMINPQQYFRLLPISDICIALVGFLLIVGAASGSGVSHRLLTFRPLVFLGVISYSLYLCHQNFAFYITELLEKVFQLHGFPELLFMLTIGFIPTILISYLSFSLFEQPFMSQGKPKRPQAKEVVVPPTSTPV